MSSPETLSCSVKSSESQDEGSATEAATTDGKSIVSDWLQKFDMGMVSSLPESACMFRDYWKTSVPKIYAPHQNCTSLQLQFDEKLAQKLLFEPLEMFICKGESGKVFKSLNEKDSPRSLCGKVFKASEPCYNCRDCGMDLTCVLCVECFKNSVHQKHRYKMNTSEGSGYCDCGDIEAWRTSPHCKIHNAALSSENSVTSPLEKLPKDLVDRAHLVFDAVLWYCLEMLARYETTYSLPQNLKLEQHELNSHKDLKETDKLFCSLLYSDNGHMPDDVKKKLALALKFTHKQALDIATLTEREGRCILHCGTLKSCSKLQKLVEQSSEMLSPVLRVTNIGSHHVAHQIFAMRLLDWLQRILGYTVGFRAIFSEIMLKEDLQCRRQKDMTSIYGRSMLESIFINDGQFLKSVCKQWYNLFITGLLMESESKKAFAKAFTKNYSILMRKLTKDEYEHTVSVNALSVQLFTVTSLSHYLIEEEDAFAVVFRVFMNAYEDSRNNVGRLDCFLWTDKISFFCSQIALYDVQYLLRTEPDTWTEKLRTHFLRGTRLLLEFLSWMQGMDPRVREVNEHIQFEEPSWEVVFELYTVMFPVLYLIRVWCASDQVALICTYKATLEGLCKNLATEDTVQCELAGHTAQCIKYDVHSQPVSIHQPLCRLLAGLHLQLQRFSVTFDSFKFFAKENFCPAIENLFEPVLRTQVLIAQITAGMWRRNGYSLLNQTYLYHSVKYRTEMLDQDILLLQVGCSLMESNKFILHLLNKFNLMNWAQDGLQEEQSDADQQQTVTLVEKFLSLVITVIGERYVPGVGQVTAEECLKKEIIQKLCVKPMTHSELNKALPSDITEETGLEKVIDQVAVLKNAPQGNGKKVYELKPEFYKDYNIFYYHYTLGEQSLSEEVQRNRQRLAEEEECCPPPALPAPTPAFKNLSHLLCCDVMQHLMKIVLQRAADKTSKTFSEGQLHRVVHLIDYALHEEERYQKEGTYFGFIEVAVKSNILPLLETQSRNPCAETLKGLLNWTLRKFHQVAAVYQRQVSVDVKEAEKIKEDSQAQRKRQAEMAAVCRAKVMAQMSAMQKNFMKKNAKMFEQADSDLEDSSCSTQMMMDTLQVDVNPVAVGPNQTKQDASKPCYTCILCQEDQMLSLESPALVLPAFVQKSTVMSQLSYSQKLLLQKSPRRDPRVLPADLNSGPYTSTCSHVMHSDCWRKSVIAKERHSRLQNYAKFYGSKFEYLCPLCECRSNTVLPILPPLGNMSPFHPSVTVHSDITFEEFIHGLEITVQHTECTQHLSDEDYELEIYQPCQQSYVVSQLGSPVGEKFARLFSGDQTGKRPLISSSLKRTMYVYSRTAYVCGLKEDLIPIFAWQSCAYTIHTIECLLRYQQKPVFSSLSVRHKDCLSNLVKLAGSSCNYPQKDMASHCLYVMSGLLTRDSSNSCILDWDAFSALVTLSFSLPNLFSCTWPSNFPAGNIQELYVLKLIFIVHIVQILLTTDFSMPVPRDVDESHGEVHQYLAEEVADTKPVQSLLQSVSAVIDSSGCHSHWSSEVIWQKVCEACIPFLRCCALFYHHLTGVPAPQELQETGTDEFHNLCRYLGLPSSCSELLGSETITALAVRWSQHEKIQQYLSSASMLTVVRYPLQVKQLIDLPAEYSELMNSASLFSCPRGCDAESSIPTLCLVCGAMLCSLSYCRQDLIEGDTSKVGACTYHAYHCGAGVGLFFQIRECRLVILTRKNKGCYIPPPYLDEYGETDEGLRRGNPLYLSPEKYKELHQLWLRHEIPEKIPPMLEADTSFGLMEWQNM